MAGLLCYECRYFEVSGAVNPEGYIPHSLLSLDSDTRCDDDGDGGIQENNSSVFSVDVINCSDQGRPKPHLPGWRCYKTSGQYTYRSGMS